MSWKQNKAAMDLFLMQECCWLDILGGVMALMSLGYRSQLFLRNRCKQELRWKFIFSVAYRLFMWHMTASKNQKGTIQNGRFSAWHGFWKYYFQQVQNTVWLLCVVPMILSAGIKKPGGVEFFQHFLSLNCPDFMHFERHLLELVCFNHHNPVTLDASSAVLLDWSWFLAHQNPKSDL